LSRNFSLTKLNSGKVGRLLLLLKRKMDYFDSFVCSSGRNEKRLATSTGNSNEN
jgi:hypothetical protein